MTDRNQEQIKNESETEFSWESPPLPSLPEPKSIKRSEFPSRLRMIGALLIVVIIIGGAWLLSFLGF